jgi:hypothetical protein
MKISQIINELIDTDIRPPAPPADQDDRGGGNKPTKAEFWVQGNHWVPIVNQGGIQGDAAQSAFINPQAFGMTPEDVMQYIDENDFSDKMMHRVYQRWLDEKGNHQGYGATHPMNFSGARTVGENLLLLEGWSHVRVDQDMDWITIISKTPQIAEQALRATTRKFPWAMQAQVISIYCGLASTGGGGNTRPHGYFTAQKLRGFSSQVCPGPMGPITGAMRWLQGGAQEPAK